MKTPLCALLLAFVATATACVPHPPAHGPVPAPAAVEVDPPRLVASLRRDFPGATVDPSTPRRIVRVRLGEVAAVLTERLRAELRLESFNILNRANYNVPDAILSSPTFGMATSAFDSRQGQVALRLEF